MTSGNSSTTLNMSLEQWIPKQPMLPSPQVEVRRESVEMRLATLLVRVESSRRSVSNSLTHDADLSELWDYYEMQIRRGNMRRHKIPAIGCNQRCRRVTFAYPSSVICRHPKQTTFVKLLKALDYRYCKGCSVLMPKSIMIEMDMIANTKKPIYRQRVYKEGMPIKCCCCGMKTAHVSVLIRRTKMGELLFKDEGY